MTTGGSALKAIARVREHGLKVGIILGIVDREEGGREVLEKEAPLVTLFRRSDFLLCADDRSRRAVGRWRRRSSLAGATRRRASTSRRRRATTSRRTTSEVYSAGRGMTSSCTTRRRRWRSGRRSRAGIFARRSSSATRPSTACRRRTAASCGRSAGLRVRGGLRVSRHRAELGFKWNDLEKTSSPWADEAAGRARQRAATRARSRSRSSPRPTSSSSFRRDAVLEDLQHSRSRRPRASDFVGPEIRLHHPADREPDRSPRALLAGLTLTQLAPITPSKPSLLEWLVDVRRGTELRVNRLAAEARRADDHHRHGRQHADRAVCSLRKSQPSITGIIRSSRMTAGCRPCHSHRVSASAVVRSRYGVAFALQQLRQGAAHVAVIVDDQYGASVSWDEFVQAFSLGCLSRAAGSQPLTATCGAIGLRQGRAASGRCAMS